MEIALKGEVLEVVVRQQQGEGRRHS